MNRCIRTLYIDTSSLPLAEPYIKLYPIVKKRVEDRCGTHCVNTVQAGAFVLRFKTDASLPAEGFCLREEEDGIAILGADFLALMYGVGCFLHRSRFLAEGLCPTDWRGQSAPACSKRMIFLAQHFHNWYQQCGVQEIREYIEDLVLWGINGVVSVFSCLNFTGWDDPKLPSMISLFQNTLSIARELGLKVGFEYSNVDFMVPRTDVAADKSRVPSKTGNLICTSTEAGFAHYQQLLSRILDYSDAFGGPDFITLWSYDEGGCSCERCFPWGGNGFYHMSHRISRYLKERYPRIEIWLATWYVGKKDYQIDEWPMLYRHLQEDTESGDHWVDYLLLETRGEYPQMYYPIEHGSPTAHIKLLTFPEISMTGIDPWGAFGAIATPQLIWRQEAPFAPYCDGGYLYSEGIFDDINKALMLSHYWDRTRPAEDILAEYCRYEFRGIREDEFIRLVTLIERSQLKTNRFTRQPCDLNDCDAAWELAQAIDRAADEHTKACWRWRLVYIRAYLDKMRYHRCAEEGWPLADLAIGCMLFWRRFLEHDAPAQQLLSELIKIYKSYGQDDAERYAYHWFVRPPRTQGADLAFEARTKAILNMK